jgi:APA family basic amino acid/polyamine antiporter
MRSVSTGGHMAVALTVMKVSLLLVIAGGALLLAQGDWNHVHWVAEHGRCEGVDPSAQGGWAGFGAAMLGALWAYDGWNNVTPLAGEIKDPARNLPRAFFGGILLVGGLYVTINLAYFYVLSPQQISDISASSSVATEVARYFMGPTATTVTALILMISSIGSLHASVLANSRIPYAMAREGLFFQSLANVSPKTHVPVNAIAAQALWATVLALSGSYDRLTDSVIFASWMFYGLSTGSLFIFRATLKDQPRPYRAFGYPVVPAIFLVMTTALIINTFVSSLSLALTGIGVMVLGLPFYWYWVRALSTNTSPSI